MNKGKNLYYGWWIVIAITVMSLATAANPFSVVLKQLMEEFHTGRGMVSLAQSISMGSGGIAGIFVGRLLLNRRPKPFILWGAVINGIMLLLISQANSLWQFYAANFIIGVSIMGFFMIAYFILLSNWFSKYWGTAMGITMGGGALSFIVITPLVGYIAEHFGWRANYLFAGFLTLCLNVPLILVVLKDTPEQMGLHRDGEPGKITEAQVLTNGSKTAMKGSNLASYLKRPALWVLAIGFALIMLGDNAVMQHQVSFLTDMKISTTVAASALGVTMGISGFAKLSAGWLADRISTRYVSILFLLFEVTGIFILMHVISVSDVWLFVIVYGLGSGTANILLPLVVKDVFGSEKFSAIFGFINVIYTMGAVFGIPMAGFIFDATGSYAAVFIIITAAYIVAMMGVYFAFGFKPKPFLKSAKE